MMIKDQEKLMLAVKTVLNAEDHLAAVLATPQPKRESKKAAKARAEIESQARISLDQTRARLREVHHEVYVAGLA